MKAKSLAPADRAAYLLTVVAAVLYVVCTAAWARWGGEAVSDLEGRLGKVLYDEAVRAERAGEYERAIDGYLSALERPFSGEADRAQALKRLGALLWWREGPEAGYPYLKQAYEHKDCPVSLYEPYCDTLLKLRRVEELPPVVDRWLSQARARGLADQAALARWYEGLYYLQKDDPQRALQAFLDGDAQQPGGVNAYEAALVYRRLGDIDKCLEYLDRFVRTGSGNRLRYAKSLRQTLLGERGSGGN